jgi:hypothetical protein
MNLKKYHIVIRPYGSQCAKRVAEKTAVGKEAGIDGPGVEEREANVNRLQPVRDRRRW